MKLSELNKNDFKLGNSLGYCLKYRLGSRLWSNLSDSLWLYFDVHLHDWITHKLAEVYDEAE